MALLTVRHVTTYRYSEPVGLGQHRMMFRPRESHDLKLLRTSLTITPNPARLRWLHDVFDNSIAIAEFDGCTSELRFESIVTLQHFETALPEYPLEEYAKTYPFRYSSEDIPNLARALAPHYPGDNVRHWAGQFQDPSGSTGTMNLLRSMTLGIKEQFRYMRRSEKGVQTPDETLRDRSRQLPGFCRPDDGSDPISWPGRSLCQRVHLRPRQRYESHRRRCDTRMDANLSAGSGLD